jgi:hypothetical protein
MTAGRPAAKDTEQEAVWRVNIRRHQFINDGFLVSAIVSASLSFCLGWRQLVPTHFSPSLVELDSHGSPLEKRYAITEETGKRFFQSAASNDF